MAGQTVTSEVEQREGTTLVTLIDQMRPQIAKALPRHMTADRLARIVTTCIRQIPNLAKCESMSVLGAVMTCSQLGLEPGPLGHVYLIPFRDTKKGTYECTLIIGYRGMLELARRSGQIESCAARVVRAKDHFDYAYGLDEKLEHKPDPAAFEDMTHVYAIVRYKDGGRDFEVMTKAQVDKIRARSKASEKGPWSTDYDEMARKTVLRRLLKRAPMSIEYAQATGQDGEVRVSVDADAIDVPPPSTDDTDPDPTGPEVVDGEIVEGAAS
jgi:recombination protein RecT